MKLHFLMFSNITAICRTFAGEPCILVLFQHSPLESDNWTKFSVSRSFQMAPYHYSQLW